MPALGGLFLRYREGIGAMVRARLKLQLKTNQLHRDVGKAPAAPQLRDVAVVQLRFEVGF